MEVEQLSVSIPFMQPTNARTKSSDRPLERGESKTMFLEVVPEPCLPLREVTLVISNFQPLEYFPGQC
jgi:hypothetical protein